MSRPFSYNDENFTVIGNVLYVLFKYEKAAKVGTRLIEIPPAICDRLLFYSNVCFAVYNIKDSHAATVVLTATNYNNKCYLATRDDILAHNGRYIFGIFMLKDI